MAKKAKRKPAKPVEPETEVYTIVLEWGDREEGLYHWSGRAISDDEATRLAREEMDSSYNEQYCDSDDPKEDFRGIEGGHATTEYVVSDVVSGVNEYAATDMLKALRLINENYELDPEHGAVLLAAIARGEGRDAENTH
jgi:hypothetical protein